MLANISLHPFILSPSYYIGLWPHGYVASLTTVLTKMNHPRGIMEDKHFSTKNLPYMAILEQPKSHTRFRFPSEKNVEKIIGELSSPVKKSYPKIQIRNYDTCVWGEAVVVVSCVSHNSVVPFIHPHTLVGPAMVRMIYK